MAKRKRKHHFNPRRPRKNSEPFMVIGFSGLGKQGQDLKELFGSMEKDEYDIGREARKAGCAPIAFPQLAKEYEEMELPAEIKSDLLQTYYAAYMDGFNSKPFKRRVICEIE